VSTKKIAYYRPVSNGPTQWHAIARILDCAASEDYLAASELDLEDVILESLNRIERAIERLPDDPGPNYSLAERVERACASVEKP